MKSPIIQNPSALQLGFDAAILSVLPFPAVVFDLATSLVIRSNSFFNGDKDCPVLTLLTKYDLGLLDDDDFRKISKLMYSNQNYFNHKLHEISNEIRTYEVHACLLPDRKNVFLYMNLLTSHKLTDLNFDVLGGWWQGIEVIDSKYRILLNQLPFGVYRTTVHGEFLYVNIAMAKMLGFESTKELYKINAAEIFVNKEDRIRQLNRWQKAIINSEEITLKTKDNRIIHVRDTGLGVLNQSGEIQYFDGIVEDITSSVLLRNELIQARDKALEADRLKISFLTNMSHEIRTPMNSILGFSSMLKRKGISHQKKEQYLDIIISRSKHLMEVLNDILDMTRIEEKQVQIETMPVVLNNLLEELHRNFLFEMESANKPIKLLLKTALTTKESLVVLDSQHLSKVFTHLLNNALKFTAEGFIEFGYTLNPENRIIFYVKDSGIGVAPGLQKAIFDRFRQADESFTREHGGLGLGLSICKGLIDLMDGRIWVESDGKTGAAFYFTLDDHNEDASLHVAVVGKSIPGFENKTVLVVEDDPASFDYLEEILCAAGCTVIHANNGNTALMLYHSSKPIDLILLDIQLPTMDGYQFAKKIREINAMVPIIAQTAHALSDDKKRCLEAGCNEYLTKPINYDQLIDKLKKYLINQ